MTGIGGACWALTSFRVESVRGHEDRRQVGTVCAAAWRWSRRCGGVRAVFLALACLLPTPATLQDAASRETAQAAPTAGLGAWTRLASFQEGQNGLWGWAFNNMTAGSRGIVYSFAGNNSGALWRFDTATNRWAATGAVTDKRHNCTLAYDSVHNRVWVSSCAPAENDVSGSGADVNYFRYYDVAG